MTGRPAEPINREAANLPQWLREKSANLWQEGSAGNKIPRAISNHK
jgi:hypothetical protein